MIWPSLLVAGTASATLTALRFWQEIAAWVSTVDPNTLLMGLTS